MADSDDSFVSDTVTEDEQEDLGAFGVMGAESKKKKCFNSGAGIYQGGVPMFSKEKSKSYFGKGGILASDVGEYWILKTRLDNNDKKRLKQIKDDFITDCNCNLVTFQTTMMTDFFNNEAKIVSPNPCCSYLKLSSMKLSGFWRKRQSKELTKTIKSCYP